MMAFPTPLWSNPNHLTSRPTTRDGAQSKQQSHQQQQQLADLAKERKSSTYTRRSSFSSQRRRGSSAATASDNFVTDATAPPALPYYALAAAAKVADRQAREHDAFAAGEPYKSPALHDGDGFGPKMLNRTTTNTSTGGAPLTPGVPLTAGGYWQQHEAQVIHQQVTDLANKRINFLDYLRKA